MKLQINCSGTLGHTSKLGPPMYFHLNLIIGISTSSPCLVDSFSFFTIWCAIPKIFRLCDLNFSLKSSKFIFHPTVQVGDLCLHELKQCLDVSGWPAVQNGPSLSEIRREQGVQEKRLCFCSKFLLHGIYCTFLIYQTPNLSLPQLFFLICYCGLSTYNWVTCTILSVLQGYKQ
jgi:hypothetical protein